MRNVIIYTLFYTSISFLLTCCNKNNDTSNLEYTFLKKENSVNPSIFGIWKSIGNGYYLEAREDSILLYSYTKSFCYKEKNDYLEGLFNSQSQFYLSGDTLSVYLTDYGKKTQELQSKKDFIKIDKLPNKCIGFSELIDLDKQKLFKLYKETLKENYAFTERRRLDWELIFKNYDDGSLLSNESLFSTMGEIAISTKDQHTKVISTSGETLQYRITPSAQIVQNAFLKQDEIKNLGDYFDLFFNENYKNITDYILKKQGKKVANGKIEWGDINEDVGYICIHSFTGFLESRYTRKQQIDSLNIHMSKIINAFKNKESIIVDVSFNFGGYDAAALTIASYFTNKSILVYKSQVYNNRSFYTEDQVVINPAEINFTKPVYVLTTDISRSAAENYAMMMKALPNVKLVGTNTLGILSGMLGKSIGNFYTTYSNQRFLDKDDKFYEVYGVEPDYKLNVFEEDDIFGSHRKAVNDIVKLIKKSRKD